MDLVRKNMVEVSTCLPSAETKFLIDCGIFNNLAPLVQLDLCQICSPIMLRSDFCGQLRINMLVLPHSAAAMKSMSVHAAGLATSEP